MKKFILYSLVIVFISGCVAIATLITAHVVNNLHHEPVKVWRQPNAFFQKGQKDPYCVVLVNRGVGWSDLSIIPHTRHLLYAGRDCKHPQYGFWLPLHHLNNKPPLPDTAILWTSEGIWFYHPDSYQVFIPNSLYQGGR